MRTPLIEWHEYPPILVGVPDAESVIGVRYEIRPKALGYQVVRDGIAITDILASSDEAEWRASEDAMRLLFVAARTATGEKKAIARKLIDRLTFATVADE